MQTVIVVGGGAAGMMAAIKASNSDNKVILIEHNEKLGKKVFITGKGRCNLTNASDIENIFNNIVSNPKFMYSSLYSFTNEDVIELFESHGMKTKVERGNRVFPASDKSSDVIKTLKNILMANNVDIRLNTELKDIGITDGKVVSISTNKGQIKCDKLILATGGLSYPLENAHRTESIFPSLDCKISSSICANPPMVCIPRLSSFLFVLLPTYNKSDTGSCNASSLPEYSHKR